MKDDIVIHIEPMDEINIPQTVYSKCKVFVITFIDKRKLLKIDINKENLK